MTAVLSGFLILCVVGCASDPTAQRRDPRLVEDCAKPVVVVEVWNDVAELAIRQRAALVECTCRMRAVRGADLGVECE